MDGHSIWERMLGLTSQKPRTVYYGRALHLGKNVGLKHPKKLVRFIMDGHSIWERMLGLTTPPPPPTHPPTHPPPKNKTEKREQKTSYGLLWTGTHLGRNVGVNVHRNPERFIRDGQPNSAWPVPVPNKP